MMEHHNIWRCQMTQKKSSIFAALMFIVDFFSSLLKELKKRNVSEDQIFDALKDKKDLIPQMAEKIADLIVGASKFALKHLQLITDQIPISIQPFQRDSFFKNGPVKLYIWDSFRDRILKAIPNLVPAFQGNLQSTQLSKDMRDSEILEELGHPKPFSLLEFSSILSYLLMKQPEGEEGKLLVNGYATIFYVELEDGRVVAVDARWGDDDRAWILDAYVLDGAFWREGYRVFSRS